MTAPPVAVAPTLAAAAPALDAALRRVGARMTSAADAPAHVVRVGDAASDDVSVAVDDAREVALLDAGARIVVRWPSSDAVLAAALRAAGRRRADPLARVHDRAALAGLLDAGLAPGDTLALLDLDGLGAINRRHGHPAGDDVLRRFLDAVTGAVRRSDHVVRYGGDELVVTLRAASPPAARAVLARVADALAPASFSAGLATADGAPGVDLLRRADRALYRAKHAGGGAVRAHGDVVVSARVTDDLAAAAAVRRAVFIDEQGIPEAIERDGRDAACVHVTATEAGVVVGAARLRIAEGRAKAERVAVLRPWRGEGVGEALMRCLEEHAARSGFAVLTLHAQLAVAPFYERLGYTPEGEVFVEAGIPHLAMWRATAS